METAENTPLDLEQLADLVFRVAYEEGVTVSTALDIVMEDHRMEPNAIMYLARQGAISWLNGSVHFLRTKAVDARVGHRAGRLFEPKEAKAAQWPSLLMPFEGADGSYKSLWEFDTEDYEHQERMGRAAIEGYQRKVQAHQLGRMLLGQNDASVTSQLPPFLLGRLNQTFQDAYSSPLQEKVQRLAASPE